MHILKNILKKCLHGNIAVLIWLCYITPFAKAEVVVVVAAKSPITSLSSSQVSQIFLGQLVEVPSAGHIIPIDQHEGEKVRNEFYKKVTGKDIPQLKSYWAKLLFAGYGRPPHSVSDNNEVKKLITENNHRIGYIDKSSVDDSVRIVLMP